MHGKTENILGHIGYQSLDKLIISSDFTIDIHKIREYNYNITKNMTPQERRYYYNERGMEIHRQIQKMQLQEVYVNNRLL